MGTIAGNLHQRSNQRGTPEKLAALSVAITLRQYLCLQIQRTISLHERLCKPFLPVIFCRYTQVSLHSEKERKREREETEQGKISSIWRLCSELYKSTEKGHVYTPCPILEVDMQGPGPWQPPCDILHRTPVIEKARELERESHG